MYLTDLSTRKMQLIYKCFACCMSRIMQTCLATLFVLMFANVRKPWGKKIFVVQLISSVNTWTSENLIIRVASKNYNTITWFKVAGSRIGIGYFPYPGTSSFLSFESGLRLHGSGVVALQTVYFFRLGVEWHSIPAWITLGIKSFHSCRNGVLIPFLQKLNDPIPFQPEWNEHSIPTGMDWTLHSWKNEMIIPYWPELNLYSAFSQTWPYHSSSPSLFWEFNISCSTGLLHWYLTCSLTMVNFVWILTSIK